MCFVGLLRWEITLLSLIQSVKCRVTRRQLQSQVDMTGSFASCTTTLMTQHSLVNRLSTLSWQTKVHQVSDERYTFVITDYRCYKKVYTKAISDPHGPMWHHWSLFCSHHICCETMDTRLVYCMVACLHCSFTDTIVPTLKWCPG